MESPRQDAPRLPLRPVYMVYPGLMPLLMMNYWMRKKLPIVGILLSGYDIKHQGKCLNLFELILGLTTQSGFLYMLYMLLTAKFSVPLVRLWNRLRRLLKKPVTIMTYEEIAQSYGIPILRLKDFNSKQTQLFFQNTGANLIISAYNNQILKPATFRKPLYGAINIHPALLPNFRGLDGPFEALYHQVKEAGVTIHKIDRNIDTGKILIQGPVRIRREDSLFSLSIRCWLLGAKLLKNALKMVERGEDEGYKQDPKDVKFPYRSFPDRPRVRELLGRGVRLVKWRDLREIFEK